MTDRRLLAGHGCNGRLTSFSPRLDPRHAMLPDPHFSVDASEIRAAHTRLARKGEESGDCFDWCHRT